MVLTCSPVPQERTDLDCDVSVRTSVSEDFTKAAVNPFSQEMLHRKELP